MLRGKIEAESNSERARSCSKMVRICLLSFEMERSVGIESLIVSGVILRKLNVHKSNDYCCFVDSMTAENISTIVKIGFIEN